MPDISYQMQLLQRMQDPNSESSPMGAMRALGSSIGGAWQNYERGTDERDAIKYFMDNDVSPETLQDFLSRHPRMPATDAWKYAGAIQTQKKAKASKDLFAEMQGYLSNTSDPDPAKLKEIGDKYKSLNPKEIMDMTNGIMTQTDFMDKVKENRRLRESSRGLQKGLTEATAPVPTRIAAGPDESGETMTYDTTWTQPKLDLNKLSGILVRFTNDPHKAAETLVEIAKAQKKEPPSVWVVDPEGKQVFVNPETAGILSQYGFKKYEAPKTEPRKLLTADEETQQIRIREAGRTPERPAKITSTVALNPTSSQPEYLMTDGSFSGKVATKVGGGVKGADIERVSDMVRAVKENPTPNDIMTINEAANGIGYSYENIDETKPGMIWGTNTKKVWRLVPLSSVSQSGSKSDSFGFTIGQKRVDKKGITRTYLGNDEWE